MPSATASALAPDETGTAVVLMAGGRAQRFPGKLEHCIEGRPLLLRCYDRVRSAGWPVVVATNGSVSRELDAALEAPMVIDRRPGEGPLSALLGVCAAIRARRLFAIAADLPQIDAAVLGELADAWRPGDEAVVPEHDGTIEPLAALYERCALLREGFELRARGKHAMRDAIERIATRFVPLSARYFRNVNRPEDLVNQT
jgi:molybdenum cofactor guanylyltransferase